MPDRPPDMHSPSTVMRRFGQEWMGSAALGVDGVTGAFAGATAAVVRGTAAEIMHLIGGDVTKLVDGRVRSARMGESR